MSELDAPQPPRTAPPVAVRSRKLFVAVIVLAIFPLLLPFPLTGLELLWIAPVAGEKLQQCTDFTCQAATDWEQLGSLLILGPSILVAFATILLGTIGLIRARRHPTSPKNKALFRVSIAWGIVWAVLFACVLCVFLFLDGVHD